MVRMDLVASLKNALDRGYTLEQAKQSLVNSGYGTGDIETASSFLTGGLGTTPQSITQAMQPIEQSEEGYYDQSEQEQIKQAINPEEMSYMEPQMGANQGYPQVQLQQSQQSQSSQKSKKSFPWTILILIIFLIFLLGGLALIIIFRKSVIEFFQTI